MPDVTRRRLLQAGSATVVGAFAGCVSTAGQSAQSTETTTEPASLTDWERSTDCEGEHDRMHDSVIKVARVQTSLADEHTPIRFGELSADEQTILRNVTEDGGYGTCDPSEAFNRFRGRVTDHVRQEDMRVYLERNRTYYGLYVEWSDQVYAY